MQLFPGGWVYSPWLGYLNIREFPVVQHHLLGPLLYIGSKPDDLWFYQKRLGIFLLSAETFPELYVNDRKGWVYLLDTDRAHACVRTAAGQIQPLTE